MLSEGQYAGSAFKKQDNEDIRNRTAKKLLTATERKLR